MSTRPEVVLVDVGGVFHLPRLELLTEALEDIGEEFDADRLHRAHYTAISRFDAGPGVVDQLMSLDAAPEIVYGTYDRVLAQALGVPEAKLEAATMSLARIFAQTGGWGTLVPGSLDGLRALAATGVRLGVVSNSDGTVEQRLRREGVAQVGDGLGVPVEVIVDSAAVGFSKPDPRIFQVALEALGVPPERVVHVGDSVAMDVHGALNAGVRPLHLDPFDDCPGGPPHDHIRSLQELAQTLQ
ncbi:MAG TPA: HAD-IA family hydrolase [Candidatus Dormibacteraeota bacterium]